MPDLNQEDLVKTMSCDCMYYMLFCFDSSAIVTEILEFSLILYLEYGIYCSGRSLQLHTFQSLLYALEQPCSKVIPQDKFLLLRILRTRMYLRFLKFRYLFYMDITRPCPGRAFFESCQISEIILISDLSSSTDCIVTNVQTPSRKKTISSASH
jgi:hypothetical protein